MKYAINAFLAIAFAGYLYMQFGHVALGNNETSREILRGQVVSVVDGDTFKLGTGSSVQKIEMIGIDAPEIGQKFGEIASKYFSELVGNRDVSVEIYGLDQFGIPQGELFLDGVSINRLLVQDGFAWVQRESHKSTMWLRLESLARENGFGLWRNYDAMAPWEFRSLSLAGS